MPGSHDVMSDHLNGAVHPDYRADPQLVHLTNAVLHGNAIAVDTRRHVAKLVSVERGLSWPLLSLLALVVLGLLFVGLEIRELRAVLQK